MNKYILIDRQNIFFTHFGVCCVITRSLFKCKDLNITEIFFPENCASYGQSQDPSNKMKQFI